MKKNRSSNCSLFMLIILLLVTSCSLSSTGTEVVPPSRTSGTVATLTLTTSPTTTNALLAVPQVSEQPNSTSVITATTPSPSKVLTPFPTAFPVPDLTESQYDSLIQVLNDKSCELPCYLGIQPGSTTWEAADSLLRSLGGSIFKEYEYDYQSVPLTIVHYIFSTEINGDRLEHNIDLFIVDHRILRMDIHLISVNSSLLVEGWDRYSIVNVLTSMGTADRIYAANDRRDGRSILFNYDETGVALAYYGTHTENQKQVCPVFEENVIFALDIVLIAPDNIPMFADFFDRPQIFFLPENADNNGVWTTTKTSLGISTDDFSRVLLANPNSCFERMSP